MSAEDLFSVLTSAQQKKLQRIVSPGPKSAWWSVEALKPKDASELRTAECRFRKDGCRCAHCFFLFVFSKCGLNWNMSWMKVFCYILYFLYLFESKTSGNVAGGVPSCLRFIFWFLFYTVFLHVAFRASVLPAFVRRYSIPERRFARAWTMQRLCWSRI